MTLLAKSIGWEDGEDGKKEFIIRLLAETKEDVPLFGADIVWRKRSLRLVRAESHEAMLEALEAARQFIMNGVELGYINVPYVTSDPATRTLPLINRAIAAAKGDA